MLSAENIQSMKQNNISIDTELTKQRVKECLRTASRAQKGEIDALAGLKRVSINRVYATGRISSKIAVAIAGVLNINPAYLTGETDEKGECDEITLDAFLVEKGYSHLTKLSAAAKKPRKPRAKKGEKKAVAAEEQLERPVAEAVAAEEIPNPVEPENQVKDDARPHRELTEDEAVQLLRALYLRVQFDQSGGTTKALKQIQALLV